MKHVETLILSMQSLSHLLHCPASLYPDGENIDLAIKVVGEAKLEKLTQQLTEFLMGGSDSSPKVIFICSCACVLLLMNC